MNREAHSSGTPQRRFPRSLHIAGSTMLGLAALIGGDERQKDMPSPEVQRRIDMTSEQARWMVEKILHNARYPEVMAVITSRIGDFQNEHPNRYVYAVALAKLLHENPKSFDATYRYFYAQLKAAAEHSDNNCFERMTGSGLVPFVTSDETQDLLTRLREHDALFDDSQVDLAIILDQYRREQQTATLASMNQFGFHARKTGDTP